MAEYIERETAIAWFMPYAHAGESIDADVLISDIKGMKAADVVPVRHGRWIKHDDGVFTCSECGNAESNESHFCRYCGAKMDLEEAKNAKQP